MHLLTKIPLAQVELRWDRELAGGGAEARAKQLRGALANAFADDDLFHQHDRASGKALYRYPQVQYRWRGERGLVVGWGAAAGRLLTMPWLDLTLRLGEDAVMVSDAALTMHYGPFGVSERLLRYHLVTPVLLFNAENYRRYQAMGPAEQQVERDRLLVAGLLMALRGVEVKFPERLYATFTEIHLRPSRYKGQELIGISGKLLCNAVLPDSFALGHAVSHGFGWLMGG